MDGLLVVDKPVGPTSHDVVARARRVLGERRIGHTGTLDPAASGVLPLVLGRATRLARFLSSSDKHYEAVVRLGVSTDTGDARGAPVGSPHAGPLPSRGDVEQALAAFRGTFLQRPPAYSAKKVGGTPSYRLARRDQAVALEPVSVTTHALEMMACDGDTITLAMTCSAGFYVRSLAQDLGDALGTGAHLAALRRTRSGEFGLEDAVPLDVVDRDRDRAVGAIIPLAAMLPRLAAVTLTEQGERHLAHGRDLGPDDLLSVPGEAAAASTRLMDRRGELVGIAERSAVAGFLHPSIVLM